MNPCAEANIHGDPAAADEVFGNKQLHEKITIVGLDVTEKCVLSAAQLMELGGNNNNNNNNNNNSNTRNGNSDNESEKSNNNNEFLYNIAKFYLHFHRSSSGMDGASSHCQSLLLLSLLSLSLFS